MKLYSRSPKTRDAHLATLGKAGWSAADIRLILRASTTMQTTAELECSVEMNERRAAEVEKRGESALRRADAIAAKYGARCVYSGDPRGCPRLVDRSAPPEKIADGTAKSPAGLPGSSWGGGYALD